MDYEAIFDASYERVKQQHAGKEAFFQAFYQRFVKADPRVAEHFAETDMERQQKMLARFDIPRAD